MSSVTRRRMVALNNVLTMYGNDAVNRVSTDNESESPDWRWEVQDPRTGEWRAEFVGSLTDCADLQHDYNNPPPGSF